MRCEACRRLILNNRYKKFKDARVHYLHQTCFEIFSNGRIKSKRKDRAGIRTGPSVKLKASYEHPNPYKCIETEPDNRTGRRQ